jgi:hypothetical protein
MKKPAWLRVAGAGAVVCLPFVVIGLLAGARQWALFIPLVILFFASLLIWVVGTVRWHAQRRHLKAPARPPVEQPPSARSLGARLRRLARNGLLALFVLIPLFILFVWLPVYKVQRIAKRVTPGMTVAELIRVVDGWWMMDVLGGDPDICSTMNSVTAGASGYTWDSGGPGEQQLSREELSDRLQHSGVMWMMFIYLTGPGSAKYAFEVTVGRDGKVRSVRGPQSWYWWIHHLRGIIR